MRLAYNTSFKLNREYSKMCGFVQARMSLEIARFAESHVGISIINYLYIVGKGIGIPITGSRLKSYDHTCISIDISLAPIATL